MDLKSTISLYGGGPGSGCNPEKGKCGRPVSTGKDYHKEFLKRGFKLTSQVRAINQRPYFDKDYKVYVRKSTGHKVDFNTKTGEYEISKDGVLVEKGKHAIGSTPDRATRAKTTYVPATKAVHQAAKANQTTLAKGIKGTEIGGNKPFDVVYKDTGIEVKTLINQKNDKITMHPSSLARKLKEAKSSGLKKVMTVVFDKRPGKNDIYMREGLGSFRLGSMTKVQNMSELKAIIQGRKK